MAPIVHGRGRRSDPWGRPRSHPQIILDCEIEFLPVGEGSKPGDAIVVRYGGQNSWELLVIDGGGLAAGRELVDHIRSNFGYNAVVTHAVVTHPDIDHASGMREVLDGLLVRNLWLHMPWEFAAEARPYFFNKNWTEQGLAQELRREYDVISELVATAAKKNIFVQQPFAGMSIGPFRIVAPYRFVYPYLVPQFDRTPDADRDALEAAGIWIGKAPGFLARMFEKATVKIQEWVPESWETERLRDGGSTSASNESSVVLYGDFGSGLRVLLTADAGILGLTMAKKFAGDNGLALREFSFIQIPHHGSRSNVGPKILNNIMGPIQPYGVVRGTAYVSAPKDDSTHPRKMVLNAFTRRGYTVAATQGRKIAFWGWVSTATRLWPATSAPICQPSRRL